MSEESEQIIQKLKDRIKELETELYFCYRNNKLEKAMENKNGSN